jgi:hypothetical protein
MQRKIIASVLSFSLMIQLPFTNIGCSAAFPTGDNDLSIYINENEHIIIKLKDGTEIETDTDDMFFIEDSSEFFYGKGDKYNYEDKSLSNFDGNFYDYDVDSTKSITNNSTSYQIFWMKDNTRLSFEAGNIFSIKPDSGKSCWVVRKYSRGYFQKFSDEFIRLDENEISEVQEFKTTWIGYTVITLTVAALIILAIALSDLGGGSSGPSGCEGGIPNPKGCGGNY